MLIGILGMGSAGQRHATNAIALGHRVIAYDENPSVLEHAFLGTRDELLKKADAIIIATPAHRHHIDIAHCLDAGKHILCEKPIALTGHSKEIEKFVVYAETKQLVFAVGFNLRFHPAIIGLKRELEQLSSRVYASFACCQYNDSKEVLTNGVINDWVCHEIDLAQYLLGPLRLLDCHASRFTVDMMLEEPNSKCIVHLHSNIHATQHLRHATIVTVESSRHIDLEADPVTNFDYRAELAAFIMRVEGNKPIAPLATARDALSVLRITEKAERHSK